MKHPMFCGSKRKYRLEGWTYKFRYYRGNKKTDSQRKLWLKIPTMIRMMI